MKNIVQSSLLYTATKKAFEAERDEALAVMSIFLELPTGVAEHTNFVEEIKAQTKKVAEAEECLKVLEDNFNYLDRGGPIKPNGDYTWVRIKDDDE